MVFYHTGVLVLCIGDESTGKDLKYEMRVYHCKLFKIYITIINRIHMKLKQNPGTNR